MNEREIFAAALQQPAGVARASFLDAACAGDSARRLRIKALLDEQEQLGSFLEASPAAAALEQTQDAAGAEQLGQTIGPYKLLQQIGEGGMGAVYMAEQHEPVQRRVALKIIKAGMDTRQVVARFEAERQALALMDHPHIAKVLDAGTTAAGRPFFVMELVKGVPITQYCDRQHLQLRERLELFVPICQAIQHAHQKGIIHRDLKPSNVLVALYDGRPVPKVIDFGVAKATSQRLTDKTMFTEFGQIVGTLEYMSPEQAELSQLDIDTRSDIYSLGVMLYELLTGTTPFEKKRLRAAAFDEVLRMIREEEPPRPSTRLSTTEQLPSIAANRSTPPAKLSGLMRGELDWIVMKALEKDRSRRYETANGLARDVERYLHDEPVLACPPSSLYLLRKYVGRRRGLVAGGALVLAALLLGAIGTTAGLMRAAWERSARESATENAETSNRLAKAATRAEGEAKALLTRAQAAERELQIATHLSRARAFRGSGQPGQRFNCLEELAQAAKLEPSDATRKQLRDEAIAALQLTDVRVIQELKARNRDGQGVWYVFDDNFKSFAVLIRNQQMMVGRVSDLTSISKFERGKVTDPWRFSGNGRWLAVNEAGATGVAETSFRDCQTGSEVLRTPGSFVGFNQDETQAAVWRRGVNQEVVFFDVASGKEWHRIAVGQGGSWPSIDLDFRVLAVVFGETVKIWNVGTGDFQKELSVPGFRAALSWHPSGKFLAYSTTDHRVHVRGVRDGRLIATSDSFRLPVSYSKFNRLGDLLAVVGWDEMLRVLDATTGELLLSIPGASPAHFGFSADDRLLGATYFEDRRQIWQIAKSTDLCRSLSGPYDSQLDAWADFSSDGLVLAKSQAEGLGLVSTRSGQELAVLPISGLPRFAPHDGALWTVGASGVYRWPWKVLPAGNAVARVEVGPPKRLTDEPFVQANFDESGKRLALGSYKKGEVTALNSEDAGGRVDIKTGGNVRSALSTDGRCIVTGPHLNRNLPIVVWNASTGQLLKEIIADPDRRNGNYSSVCAAFSHDGAELATSCERGLYLWSTVTWEKLRVIPRQFGSWPGVVGYSPDGRMIAYAKTPLAVVLLDRRSGNELAVLPVPGLRRLSGVELWFSRNGDQLAVSGIGNSVTVWNLRAIRAELAKLGLDWNLPEFPPQPTSADIVSVEVKLGALRP